MEIGAPDPEQSRLYSDVIEEVPTPSAVPDSDPSTTAVLPNGPKEAEPCLEANQVVPTPCRTSGMPAHAGPETPGSKDPESLGPNNTGTASSKETETPGSTPCRNSGMPAHAGPETPGSKDPESLGPKNTGTPSSKETETPGSTETGTPGATDLESERPTPGELRLSQNAIDLRMHRMFKIDSKGNSKVSTEIRKQWHSKKGKLRLQQLFQTCGYDTDWCWKNLWWATWLFVGSTTT